MQAFDTALYGRTSGDDPKRVTIEIQQTALTRWASTDEQVAGVVDGYWDEGVSGKIPIEDRPEGGRLIKDVRDGKVGCVAVAYVDRFGRTLLDGLQAVKLLESYGVKLVALSDGWDSRRNDSPLNFQLRLMLAEEEHRRIAERMSNGKIRAMAEDNAPPGGPLTFGYQMDSQGRYVIDPVEGPIVMRCFEMALEGATNRDIHRYLLTQPVTAGRKFQRRSEGAKPLVCTHQVEAKIHPSKVTKILSNPTYTGVRKWGARTFPCPALVDEQTFATVQQRAKELTARWRPVREETPWLCSGLFSCALCKRPFYRLPTVSYRRNGTRDDYSMYACDGNRRRQGCKAKMVRQDIVDREVWARVEEYLRYPEDVVRRCLASDEVVRGEVADLEQAEKDGEHQLAAIDREVEATWEEARANDWPLSWVTPRLNCLKERRDAVQARLTSIRRGRAASLVGQAKTGEVVQFLAAWRAMLAAGLNSNDKQRLIRLIVAEGVIETIGEGRAKQAVLRMALRWGEVASGQIPKQCCQGKPPDATFPMTLIFGRAS